MSSKKARVANIYIFPGLDNIYDLIVSKQSSKKMTIILLKTQLL